MNLKFKKVLLSATIFASLFIDSQMVAQNTSPADTINFYDITAAPSSVMPTSWTFDDCLSWALNNNTDVRRTMLNILTARQDLLSAKDEWLPTVDFSTNQGFTNYPSTETGHKSNIYSSAYNVGASWTVWDGNVRKYRIESAKLLEQQQGLTGDNIVKTLKLGILEAYLNIMYAGEAVTIARQTLEVSTSQAERSKRLTESGLTSRVESAQMESQRVQDAYNLTQAIGNYENAKLALKKILMLGIDYNLNVDTVQFPDAEILAPLPDKIEVFNLATEWLPELKSNKLSQSIYANDIKIAKAGHLPSIALQGNVGTGYTSGNGNSWGSTMKYNLNENIGLTLRVPIFDGNSTKRAVAKARLAELEYDLNKKELLDNLSQTIEGLYINAINARAKYEAGLAQLSAVQLNDELVNRQFELGSVNPLDLLTAHNNLLNARLELLQSKYMAILAQKTIHYYATQQLNLK
ncbi:MAG: TolC family protein [Muribaculaceae bacterium]|nr:TolC family protein [Muribaculaceae bacterium]